VIKPTRIIIPHSLFSPDEEDHTICLFCRSDDKKEIQEYLTTQPIIGVTKVLSINDVKKYHSQIKDKKTLLKAHTHFICDARIAPHLYNLLGTTFSARNNLPVQINFTKASMLPSIITKIVSSTYCNLKGTNVSIRFGHLGMSAEQVLENMLEGVVCFVSKLKNEWKDVHSIHIKTSDSASLPVYSKSADAMLQYIAQKSAPSEDTFEPSQKNDKKKAKKGGSTSCSNAQLSVDSATSNSSSSSTSSIIPKAVKKEASVISSSKSSLLKAPVRAKSLLSTSVAREEDSSSSKKRSLSVSSRGSISSARSVDDENVVVNVDAPKKVGTTRLEPPVKRSKIPKPLSKVVKK
jgi:ribosome biogenesis protein UTP30